MAAIAGIAKGIGHAVSTAAKTAGKVASTAAKAAAKKAGDTASKQAMQQDMNRRSQRRPSAGRWLLAAGGVAVTGMLLVAATVVVVPVLLFSAMSSSASAAGSSSCLAGSVTVTGQPTESMTIAGGGRSITLDAQQWSNAATIVVVARQAGNERAAQIAIMTALQESSLKVLANPAVPESQALPNQGSGQNFDSVGLFQQRPSAGWGDVATLMDPAGSTRAFLGGQGGPTGLLDVPGWETMDLGAAAQTVQVSAYPIAYAQWEGVAGGIVSQLAGVSGTGAASSCGGDTPASLNGEFQIFAEASPLRNQVAQYGQQFLGTPYVWGGSDPATGLDCSGFTQLVMRHFGVELPRTAAEQGRVGTPVPADQALPGDLVAWNDGSHIAIYLGGHMIVEAAEPGTPLRVHEQWSDAVHYVRVLPEQ